MIDRSIASCPASEYVPSLSDNGCSRSRCAYAPRCSMLCTLVTHRSYVPLPRATVRPEPESICFDVRRLYALKPTPWPTRKPLPSVSPAVRPKPRCTVTQSFGCPGTPNTGVTTLRPPKFSSIASFSSILSFDIISRLISAALSQLMLVTCFGSSCSQPLLA